MVDESLVQGLVHRIESHGVGFSGKNLLETLVLLLAVGQDIELIVLQQIVFQGTLEQFEILVKQRLGLCAEGDGHIRRGMWSPGELNALQPHYLFGKSLSTQELRLLVQLLHDGFLLHLGSALQLLVECLSGKSLVINPADGVAHKGQIFDHHRQRQRVGHKLQQRHLFTFDGIHFGHNLHLGSLVF